MQAMDEIDLYELGLDYFGKGEFQQAFHLCNVAVVSLNCEPYGFLNNASVHSSFDTLTIRHAFQEKNDTSCDYHKLRANCHWKLRDYDSAIDDFVKSVEINADCHECWLELGELYVETKRYEEAKNGENVTNMR